MRLPLIHGIITMTSKPATITKTSVLVSFFVSVVTIVMIA